MKKKKKDVAFSPEYSAEVSIAKTLERKLANQKRKLQAEYRSKLDARIAIWILAVSLWWLFIISLITK